MFPVLAKEVQFYRDAYTTLSTLTGRFPREVPQELKNLSMEVTVIALNVLGICAAVGIAAATPNDQIRALQFATIDARRYQESFGNIRHQLDNVFYDPRGNGERVRILPFKIPPQAREVATSLLVITTTMSDVLHRKPAEIPMEERAAAVKDLAPSAAATAGAAAAAGAGAGAAAIVEAQDLLREMRVYGEAVERETAGADGAGAGDRK